MSSPPEQPQMDAAARQLRELLVRLLTDSTMGGGVLEQVIKDALARTDAATKQQLGQIEQELARLSQQLQAAGGAGGPAQDDTARTLQLLRAEVASLREQVQRLARVVSAQSGGPRADAYAWRRLWRPALVVLACGAALVAFTYVLFAQRPAPAPASVAQARGAARQPHTEPAAAPLSRPRWHPPAGAVSQSSQAEAAEAPQIGSWDHAWDLAVTQAFSCPGDPGASTLLQCACPEVLPAPQVGYPYDGVGARCLPVSGWDGRVAVAALQAVLKVQDPERRIDVDGIAGHPLSEPLKMLARRCSLPALPELTTPGNPGAGAAAIRVLDYLRSHPDCLEAR